MKAKIILKKDNLRVINLIYDLVKACNGITLNYSDRYIVVEAKIEGELDGILNKIRGDLVISKDIERIV